MNISFQISFLIVIILVTLSVAASIYIYRHTVPVVSRRKRIVLIILRATAFTLALVALCEPLFQLTSTQNVAPAIVVLVDNSLSMSQTDKSGSREMETKSLLKKESFSKLLSSTNAQLYKFSHTLSPLVIDSLAMSGGSTDISKAIQSAMENSQSAVHSILLITDGNYNAGSNPLYVSERLPVSVFTVGIGDTTDQTDILVSKIITNSIGYVNASLPVDAAIKSVGTNALSVSVSLLEDGKRIDEKRIALPSSYGTTVETPVQFTYTPKAEGIKKLTVHVSEIENEITTKNNARSVLVKILKSKFNVVVIAGPLSPDVSVVMQILHNDENINTILFFQLPNGEFKTSQASTISQALSTADCVILAGYPTQESAVSDIRTIQQSVERKSLPVLFLASRTIALEKVKQLESVLPVTIVSNRMDEQTVFPNLPPQHKYHALVQIDPERFPAFSWDKMPPLYASFQSFAAKPEAQTLLSVKIQGVVLQNPLLSIRSVANTKSMALLGYGIHRWKLLASSSDETRGVFDDWFSSLIRWLSTREEGKQLRVAPVKDFYSQGEPVEFSAEVYNENFQPIDNADVCLELYDSQRRRMDDVSFHSIGSGRYEVTSDGLAEGEYSYRAAATLNADTVGVTTGRLFVGEQSIEFAETKMNKTLLQQIANSSGGLYSDASGFDSLVEKILSRPEMKKQEQIHTSEFELWNLPAYLGLIIVLFAVEWFIRKQSGML